MSDVVIAIDIGGTTIKSALVDAHGDPAVRHTQRDPTGANRGPDAVVHAILDIAEGLADRARQTGLNPVAVGLVAPAVIDEATGVAVWAANVGFRDVPLRDLVHGRLRLPAALGHDVRAGALAEARLGAGRGRARVWFVAIGTGIAGGYVHDGQIDRGAHGAAGEIGHVVIRPDGLACTCGSRGCLETLASAAWVARRYAERSGLTASTPEVVARANQPGDEAARAVWAEAIDALADGLRIGVTLYDPDVIVLGGGLSRAGDALFGPVGQSLRQRLTFQTMPDLIPAALGDQAGSLGAALLARQALTARPT